MNISSNSILSVLGFMFPAQPYSGLIVCSQKRNGNLLELILVLPKQKKKVLKV